MTNVDAIKMLRELGHSFVVTLIERFPDKVKADVENDSDLMNGLVAYEMLNLKGLYKDLDESVDIVMRIIYKIVKEQLEK